MHTKPPEQCLGTGRQGPRRSRHTGSYFKTATSNHNPKEITLDSGQLHRDRRPLLPQRTPWGWGTRASTELTQGEEGLQSRCGEHPHVHT